MKHHIMEQIINSFARSLLIYIGTPMMAAGLWSRQDIERIERQVFKKMAMVPNNINPDIITNLMREKQPAWVVIERLARKNNRSNERQSTLTWSERKKTEKTYREPMYIPKNIAEQIWATSVNKTEIRYSRENICTGCNQTLSTEHIKRCTLFTDILYPDNFIHQLKRKNIREWDKREMSEGLEAF